MLRGDKCKGLAAYLVFVVMVIGLLSGVFFDSCSSIYASNFGQHYPLFDQETLGSELVTNGGFENFTGTIDDGTSDDFDDLTESNSDGDGDKTEATATAYSGDYALKITRGVAGGQAYVRTNNVPVTAGKIYKSTFYSRVDTGDGPPRFAIYDATGSAWITTLQSATGITTAYAQTKHYFIAPAGCSNIRLYFYTSGTNTDVAYFDEFSIKEVTSPDKSLVPPDLWPQLAGSEAIADSDNRDFADGTINEWTVEAGGGGDGTCVYDAGPGGTEKCAMITSNPGGAGVADTYLYGKLTTASGGWTCSANTFHRVQADVRVPAANTLKNAKISTGYLTGVIIANTSVTTLNNDTWTTIVEYIYVAADNAGQMRAGFNGNPADDDVMYIDNISIRTIQISWVATMPMEIDETNDWLKVTGDGTDDIGIVLTLAAAGDLIDNPTVNARYQFRAEVKVGTGDSVDIEAAQSDDTELDSETITSTSAVWVDLFFTCTNATTDKIQLDNLGNGEEFYIRKESLRLGGG